MARKGAYKKKNSVSLLRSSVIPLTELRMTITEVTQVSRRCYGGYAGVTEVLRRCYAGVTQVLRRLRRCYGVVVFNYAGAYGGP